jgi:hypothetical protein
LALAQAVELGCHLSINPDAHSVREFDLVQWGLVLARKGGVEKQSVLNAKSPARERERGRTRCQIAKSTALRDTVAGSLKMVNGTAADDAPQFGNAAHPMGGPTASPTKASFYRHERWSSPFQLGIRLRTSGSCARSASSRVCGRR